jgi:hypothetical protein
MNPLITFHIGEESRAKIESINEMEKSLFQEQYEKSFSEISKYLSQKEESNQPVGQEALNNIFAFIGERGSGKTSCMLSVANMLPHRSDKKFHLLEQPVDPSFFDDKHNIIEITIAKLFSQFSTEVKEKNKNNCDEPEIKKKTLESFESAYKDIELMLNTGNSSTGEDSLEKIDNLAAGVNLNTHIKELIDSYLKYFGDEVLVLSVDDVDINTKHAFTMVEQIRKYLVHPKVVVLLAVKLDQLALAVKLQNYKEFEILLDNKNISSDMIDEMTDRYLGKFIPLGQRIFLPDASVYFKSKLKLTEKDKDGKEVEYDNVRDAVTTLIFRKTRYLFYHTRGTTSYIVPRNLRELRHLIAMLYAMKDYKENGEEHLYNKDLFKKYFFETWTANNLSIDGQKLIHKLLDVTDAAIFNKMTIDLLQAHFKYPKYPKARFKKIEEIDYIFSDENVTYNISIGDVMSVIRFFEHTATDGYDLKLLFWIRSIYSIKLYEYYDAVPSEQKAYNKEKDKEVLRREKLLGYTDYDKIVGGNFINSEYLNIIQGDRAQGGINIKPIKDIIKELEGADLPLTEDQGKKLRIVEFFALTISHRYNSKSSKSFRTYRESTYNNETYYGEDIDIKGNYKYAHFDIASAFYNITTLDKERTMKHAYDRFSDKLFELASKSEHSLLKKIKDADTTGRSFLSAVSIRNAEILDDITDSLIRDPRQSGEKANAKNILSNFFERTAEYKIKTYDRGENGNEPNGEPYEIVFKYMQALVDVLDEMDDETFNEIYLIGSEESLSDLDIEKIIDEIKRRKDEDPYMPSTVKGAIYKVHPRFKENEDIDSELNKVFPAKKRITLTDIEKKLTELKGSSDNG